MYVYMALNLNLVRTGSDFLYAICKLYENAFPEEERRPTDKFLNMIDAEPMFRTFALTIDGGFVGFITCWTFRDFTYVEHFAIEPLRRGEGYGGMALTCFLKSQNRPVVLEVELPLTIIAQKRIHFYEKYQFVRLLDRYQQPPYRKGSSWLPMSLMLHKRNDIVLEVEEIKKVLYEYVYKVRM